MSSKQVHISLADCHWLLTKATFAFSESFTVLMVLVLPVGFFLKEEPISQKFWTHNLNVLWAGTLSLWLTLKWRWNKCWVLTSDLIKKTTFWLWKYDVVWTSIPLLSNCFQTSHDEQKLTTPTPVVPVIISFKTGLVPLLHTVQKMEVISAIQFLKSIEWA